MVGKADATDTNVPYGGPAAYVKGGERSPARSAEMVPSGGSATLCGYFGALPNFSGAETDPRLIELWLRDKAPEMRCQYAQDLEKFSDFSGGKPLSSVTLADLQEFAEFVSVLVAPASWTNWKSWVLLGR